MTKEKVFISEADQYLFAQGTHYDIYKKLGAHLWTEDGVQGVSSHAEAGRRWYLGVVRSRRGRRNNV